MTAYLLLILSLAMGLQVCAVMLGSLLYPCGWMRYVIFLRLAVTAASAVSALVALKHGNGEECGEDDVRTLRKAERRVWLIWLGMLADALLLGFAAGAVSGHVHAAISITAGLIMVAPLLSFALCWPSSEQPHGRRNELLRSDFPMIHAALRDAARSTDHRRRARLFLGEGTACAFVGVGYDGIILSPLFLTALTRQELRQVFLHELTHLTSQEVRREIRWRRLAARQMHARACMQDSCMLLAIAPVLVTVARFSGRLTQYRKRIEPLREREADVQTAALGDAGHAAAAIAKAEFVERFIEENEGPFCDMAALREAYEEALAEYGRTWLAELEQQASGSDPHPTFRERREIFGPARFDPFEREINSAWLWEIERACVKADENRKRR